MVYKPIVNLSLKPEQVAGVVDGMYMVVFEAGLGNVQFYAFYDEKAASEFYDSIKYTRILLDPTLKELRSSRSLNVLALSTLRTKVHKCEAGMIEGKVMVVVEAGLGNLKFYAFTDLDKATAFFESIAFSRILYDAAHKELRTGGINPLALRSIRKKVHNSAARSSLVWW